MLHSQSLSNTIYRLDLSEMDTVMINGTDQSLCKAVCGGELVCYDHSYSLLCYTFILIPHAHYLVKKIP